MEKGAVNTDRELWREVEGDALAPSLHVTENGMIGINVGGTVHVKNLRKWHQLAEYEMGDGLWGKGAEQIPTPRGLMSIANVEPDPKYEYMEYLQLLIQLQSVGHDCHNEINDTLKKLHRTIFKSA